MTTKLSRDQTNTLSSLSALPAFSAVNPGVIDC
jgi:hypothetical protein